MSQTKQRMSDRIQDPVDEAVRLLVKQHGLKYVLQGLKNLADDQVQKRSNFERYYGGRSADISIWKSLQGVFDCTLYAVIAADEFGRFETL